jgi:hypothetical protein
MDNYTALFLRGRQTAVLPEQSLFAKWLLLAETMTSASS